METRRSPSPRLSTMTKSRAGSDGIAVHSSSRMRAAGGGLERRRERKPSSAAFSPKASIVTPSASLLTRPAIPCSRARR